MAARRAAQKKDVCTVVENSEQFAQWVGQSDKVLIGMDSAAAASL